MPHPWGSVGDVYKNMLEMQKELLRVRVEAEIIQYYSNAILVLLVLPLKKKTENVILYSIKRESLC